jgi:hypothetical protein
MTIMSSAAREKLDNLLEDNLSKLVKNLGNNINSIRLLGELVEHFYSKGEFHTAEYLRSAHSVIIPRMLNEPPTDERISTKKEAELISEAIAFGATYHVLRDAIYYSYATTSPVLISEPNDNSLSIVFPDKSIHRQLATEAQLFLLNSTKQGFKSDIDLVSELKGTREWDTGNPAVSSVLEVISQEVQWKIAHLFSYFPKDNQLDMGGYSYNQFHRVYEELLYLALYSRYYAFANKLPNVIDYEQEKLLSALHNATEIPHEICNRILSAIAQASASSFIFHSSSEKFFLFPCCFSLVDVLARQLRNFARDNAKQFLNGLSNPIGDALVDEISSYFSGFRNFRVRREIDLSKFDSSLPDIDVLALSYEPSMGFHAFICEAKNNLPAHWAKEYLKSAGKGGTVTKALDQTRRIRDFLNTEQGGQLLYNIVKEDFSDLDYKILFPTGFCVVIDVLIITSQSCGMFFPDESTAIINSGLLQHITEASDGDIVYMQQFIRGLNKVMDDTYEVNTTSTVINGTTITWEGAKLTKLIKFPNNSYLSTDQDRALEQESLKHEYRFIDTLRPDD